MGGVAATTRVVTVHRMLIVAAAVVLVVVLAAVLVAAVVTAGPSVSRVVIVHTCRPDDQSIRGVMTSRSRRWIRLEAAEYATEDGWVKLDEHVAWIPARSVSFLQESDAGRDR